MVPEIQNKYEKKELIQLLKRFRSVGSDFCISFPYFIIGEQYISIGDNFQAKKYLRLEAIKEYGNQIFNPEIIIGNNVSMEFNCHIGAIDKITIGDNVLIGSNIFMADNCHGEIKKDELKIPPLFRALSSKGDINIGKNVWIGDSVSILRGVHIGENTIIGANSVVTKSFPANVVIAGNPARILKEL